MQGLYNYTSNYFDHTTDAQVGLLQAYDYATIEDLFNPQTSSEVLPKEKFYCKSLSIADGVSRTKVPRLENTPQRVAFSEQLVTHEDGVAVSYTEVEEEDYSEHFAYYGTPRLVQQAVKGSRNDRHARFINHELGEVGFLCEEYWVNGPIEDHEYWGDYQYFLTKRVGTRTKEVTNYIKTRNLTKYKESTGALLIPTEGEAHDRYWNQVLHYIKVDTEKRTEALNNIFKELKLADNNDYKYLYREAHICHIDELTLDQYRNDIPYSWRETGVREHYDQIEEVLVRVAPVRTRKRKRASRRYPYRRRPDTQEIGRVEARAIGKASVDVYELKGKVVHHLLTNVSSITYPNANALTDQRFAELIQNGTLITSGDYP